MSVFPDFVSPFLDFVSAFPDFVSPFLGPERQNFGGRPGAGWGSDTVIQKRTRNHKKSSAFNGFDVCFSIGPFHKGAVQNEIGS